MKVRDLDEEKENAHAVFSTGEKTWYLTHIDFVERKFEFLVYADDWSDVEKKRFGFTEFARRYDRDESLFREE